MLESIIDENLIDKLDNNYDEYYYIYYYCIVSKEELITNEIILNIIDNCSNKINPYLDIVRMNKQLNNDIIMKILDKTKNISLLDTQTIYGPIPFDLRYHILKREEINEDLKEEVLNRYDKIRGYFRIINILQNYNAIRTTRVDVTLLYGPLDWLKLNTPPPVPLLLVPPRSNQGYDVSTNIAISSYHDNPADHDELPEDKTISPVASPNLALLYAA